MAKDRLYFASLHECNEDCLFCVRRGDEEPIEYLDTEECKKRIARASEENWKTLEFDGGEPTLRNDLPELIQHARKVGFKDVCILTNGVRLSDREYTKKLIQALESGDRDFTYSFSVSLHSHKKDISEYLTNSKNTFEKTIQGLKNLIQLEAEGISVYHIMTKYNYKDLPDFVRYLDENFPEIRFLVFSFIYPTGAALKNKHIFPKLSELEDYLYKALELCEEKEIQFTISTCGTIPLCYLRGYEEYTVNQQRLDQPENIGLLDSKQKARYQLATEEFHQKTKIKAKRCSLCHLNELCGGLWKTYAELYGTDELKPVLKPKGYKRFSIEPEEIEKYKEKIENLSEIVFLDFDVDESISKEDCKKILDFIEGIKGKANYIVERPLPLHRIGVKTETLRKLRIPLSCVSCKKLFQVKERKTILCTGKSVGNIESYRNRKKIHKKMKESLKDLENLKEKKEYKECWMRKYIT